MKIDYHKAFIKAYAKLSAKHRLKADKSVLMFQQNPFHPLLNNHALNGKMEGKRSISAGNDLRLVFEEHDKYTIVLFLDVGTHNQVYI